MQEVDRTALSAWRDGEEGRTNNNWYSCTADNSKREVEGLVHACTNRYHLAPSLCPKITREHVGEPYSEFPS